MARVAGDQYEQEADLIVQQMGPIQRKVQRQEETEEPGQPQFVAEEIQLPIVQRMRTPAELPMSQQQIALGIALTAGDVQRQGVQAQATNAERQDTVFTMSTDSLPKLIALAAGHHPSWQGRRAPFHFSMGR